MHSTCLETKETLILPWQLTLSTYLEEVYTSQCSGLWKKYTPPTALVSGRSKRHPDFWRSGTFQCTEKELLTSKLRPRKLPHTDSLTEHRYTASHYCLATYNPLSATDCWFLQWPSALPPELSECNNTSCVAIFPVRHQESPTVGHHTMKIKAPLFPGSPWSGNGRAQGCQQRKLPRWDPTHQDSVLTLLMCSAGSVCWKIYRLGKCCGCHPKQW